MNIIRIRILVMLLGNFVISDAVFCMDFTTPKPRKRFTPIEEEIIVINQKKKKFIPIIESVDHELEELGRKVKELGFTIEDIINLKNLKNSTEYQEFLEEKNNRDNNFCDFLNDSEINITQSILIDNTHDIKS